MKKDQTRSLLELLYHVSREVATALDLRTVLQRVLYAAIDNVGGERGSIVVMDDHGKPVDSVIVYGRRIHGGTTQQLRVTVERGLAGWVVRNRKPALVPDTSQDERWLRRPDDSAQKTGAKAAICVPLLAREKIVGVLTLVHSLPNAFDESHLKLMQAIADQAGVAVLNARLYTESQRQARVMTALADGAVTINASLQMQEVFQRILNQTLQALPVETVALALQEQPSGDFVFRAATGNHAGSIIDLRLPANDGLTCKVLHDRRGFVIPAIKDNRAFSKRDFFDEIDSHAVAIAPIQAQGKIIGVLEAINPTSGTFDPDALLVMTGIGSLAGSTIQHAQLFERVEETQKRYYELFNDSIDPILITDWQGNILEANRKALAISGYDHDDFRQLHINELHNLEDGEIDKNFEVLRDSSLQKYESTLNTKDRHTIPIEVYVRKIYLEDEEALQWTFRDITERKALDRLRDDMASMIYHDLRSPLANVLSSLNMLSTLSETDDENSAMLLKIAGSSAERIQRLVSSLLDINRLEAGQDILSQSEVQPANLIKDAIEAVLPSTKSREQQLLTILPENIPSVWVDEDMIRRVLINLLENASKFTPVKGHLEIGAKVENDSWVMFWVTDTGVGIAPEHRKLVFEKFARVKGEEKVSGLGVGLAFCRLAVDGHGGNIWVDEENTQGTRFNLTVPIFTEEEEKA